MKRIQLSLHTPVPNTYRTDRVKSLFNVTSDHGSRVSLNAEIPSDDDDWQVGLIVGPSGSGKTSLGTAAWGGRHLHKGFRWGPGPIIDEIAPNSPVDAVTGALSAVGLGTVPAWLRPFKVLSMGEQFRADLARLLLSNKKRVVVDEFTSVVDRQVAKIGAAAFVKAWRRDPSRRVILLSCHRDIVEWVQPDWVLDTQDMSLQRGCQRPRPSITADIFKTNWKPYEQIFEKHHYLKLPHMIAATNYVAAVDGQPVAHCAVSTCTGLTTARMCRLVVLPEWQGAGIGLRFMNRVAQDWIDGENRYGKKMTTVFHTSHPGLASALRHRSEWIFMRGRVLGESGVGSAASMARSGLRKRKYGGHMRAVQTFRYVGAPA